MHEHEKLMLWLAPEVSLLVGLVVPKTYAQLF